MNEKLSTLAVARATELARAKYPAPIWIAINFHVYEIDGKPAYDLYCVHGPTRFIQSGKTMGEFLETYIPPIQCQS